METEKTIESAVHLFEIGRLAEADDVCRRILADDPNNVKAMHLLGVVLCQGNHIPEAIEVFNFALALRPSDPVLLGNLGGAMQMGGRVDEAIVAYQKALQLQPEIGEIWFNLGIATGMKERWGESIAAYERAKLLRPNDAEIYFNLGNALRSAGRSDEALAAFRQAVVIQRDYADAFSHIGSLLREKGKFDEATAAFRQALAAKPVDARAAYNLANALRENGEVDEAIACYQTALGMLGRFPGAAYNLGNTAREKNDFDQAAIAYQTALAMEPDCPDAYNNLGGTFKDIGELDKAIACYEAELAQHPNQPAVHSNKLYTLHFHPDFDSRKLFEEHAIWNERYAKPLTGEILPHDNDPSPDRPLRIGYVSADFRQHPVGLAMEPLLRNHDRSQFHVFCFSNVAREDAVSARLKNSVDEWHPIFGLTDEKFAQRVRECKIDILVDLSLHLGNNRLLTFARKPAPVQVTYLGYPGTTGLTTIDYRLSDSHIDPVSLFSPLPVGTQGEWTRQSTQEPWYSEKTVRLPKTYLCWKWNGTDETVGPLPALSNGYITFGSLNNFCKVTPVVLETWGRLMSRVKNSRLLLRCPHGEASKRVHEALARHGVNSDRVELFGVLPWPRYVQLLGRQDIGLDPFPYPGHTTSLDSLWMGVPIVTLSGKTAVSRAGDSLMNNLNLRELVAHDVDGYIGIAEILAGDLPRLTRLRMDLRERMKQSPIMDYKQFARDVEAAYRGMWRTWSTKTS